MKKPKIMKWTRWMLGCWPGVALGAGYYLPNQDTSATARGNAFVATADTAAAVHYNPAGLTQIERPEVSGGFYLIQLGNDAIIGGDRYEAESEWQVAPHLYYAKPLNDRLTLGFGLNSPYGLGTEWGQDTPFRTVVTEARLSYISATAAVGYEINDQLSIGASLSGNRADLTLEQGLALPGSYLRFEGDAFCVSGALALRWQPHEKHAFGLVFSSESSPDLEGRATSDLLPSSDAEMEFFTPVRIAGGYSFRPAEGWNIEANVEWLDWDSLNNLYLKSPVLGKVAVPFNWESMFIYELGVSYKTPEGWAFAAGYDYNSNASPDASFNPGVADADRHWFNIGVGREFADWSWAFTYQFGYSNREVNGALGPGVNGRYEARHHALMLGGSYRF